jgi:membrane protease YdiL (CAAX protease family)
MNGFNRRKLLILALPMILFGTMYALFTILVNWLGQDIGYLLGFAGYWFIFGLAIPVLVSGRDHFGSLLKDRNLLFNRQNWMTAMLWIIVTGVTLVMYGNAFLAGPFSLILIALPLAMINGVCEEIFWRGIFVKVFPDNPWLGIVYPAAGFALWHFIPQSVFPADNVYSFVFSTLFLGLVYGFIAYRTGSAKWTTISHCLNGILALSGMLAPILLKLMDRL